MSCIGLNWIVYCACKSEHCMLNIWLCKKSMTACSNLLAESNTCTLMHGPFQGMSVCSVLDQHILESSIWKEQSWEPKDWRIGNMLAPNDVYGKFDKWIMPIFDAMAKEQHDDNVLWTPSKVRFMSYMSSLIPRSLPFTSLQASDMPWSFDFLNSQCCPQNLCLKTLAVRLAMNRAFCLPCLQSSASKQWDKIASY